MNGCIHPQWTFKHNGDESRADDPEDIPDSVDICKCDVCGEKWTRSSDGSWYQEHWTVADELSGAGAGSWNL